MQARSLHIQLRGFAVQAPLFIINSFLHFHNDAEENSLYRIAYPLGP